MKKSFKQFLENRPKKQVCKHHPDTEWCSYCLARPQLVGQELPDGTISYGYVISNI